MCHFGVNGVHMLVFLAATWASAASAGVFPYTVTSRTFDDGLTVHVVPTPSPGVCAYYTWMAVGSRDETDAGRTGFAHFFEHLMFYGTETNGHEARQRLILRTGADENAWTGIDETVYHAVISTAELPTLVSLEADRFEHLHLTDDDIRRESGAVYGEYRKNRANPDNALSDALYGGAFTSHTYRHATIGFEPDIAAMPTAVDYAHGFFDRMYRPENATILVVGDVKPEDVFAMVGKAYAGWSRGAVPRPVAPLEPPQKGVRRVHVDWDTATATRLAMGWHIPASRPDDPEVAALQLASDYLFSPTGPLQRRLVEGEGLAYRVSGGRDDTVDPGLFQLEVTLKDEKSLARAEAIVREEIANVEKGLPTSTVDATRTHARYAFLSTLDDPESVGLALGSSLRRGGTPDAIDRFYVRYDAVTPDDIAKAAAKFLVDDNLTVAVLATKAAK